MSSATQAIQDAISSLNTETDNIASRLDALVAQIGQGVTAQDAGVITSQLTSIAGRLRTLASNPSDPVPSGPVSPGEPLPV